MHACLVMVIARATKLRLAIVTIILVVVQSANHRRQIPHADVFIKVSGRAGERLLDFFSHNCRLPDKSIGTCVQGGGDCEGYKHASCDCDYHPGGCSISQTAPHDTACKCKYKGGWTCGGEVERCLDPSSRYCRIPDQSAQSCFQGNGDCEGYKNAQCDCDNSRGGCKISRVPPPNTACKCKYKGWWTCGGDITRCKNPSNHCDGIASSGKIRWCNVLAVY